MVVAGARLHSGKLKTVFHLAWINVVGSLMGLYAFSRGIVPCFQITPALGNVGMVASLFAHFVHTCFVAFSNRLRDLLGVVK